MEGYLPTLLGLEGRTRKAQKGGWSLLYQVLLTHYGYSASRSHATYTRTTDYVAVPEEAAPLERLRSVTEYQGLTQRELAEKLGLSFSGAKSRVQRAREKLKKMLLDCCHFELDRRGKVIDYRPNCDCCSNGDGCSGCT